CYGSFIGPNGFQCQNVSSTPASINVMPQHLHTHFLIALDQAHLILISDSWSSDERRVVIDSNGFQCQNDSSTPASINVMPQHLHTQFLIALDQAHLILISA